MHVFEPLQLKGAVKPAMKLIGTAIVRGGARAVVKGGGSSITPGVADAAETTCTFGATAASSFRVGYSAALSATAVGLFLVLHLGQI